MLFVEQGILLVDGTLDCTGEVPVLLPFDGSDPIRIPEHLMDLIETVTDEHRECLEELTTPYCLRASYDGRLDEHDVDIDAVLAHSSGDLEAE